VLNAVITAQPGSHPVLTATPAKIFTQIHMRTAVSVPSCCNDTNRDNLQQHPPRRARRETRSETWRVKPGEHAEFWGALVPALRFSPRKSMSAGPGWGRSSPQR